MINEISYDSKHQQAEPNILLVLMNIEKFMS